MMAAALGVSILTGWLGTVMI